MDDPFAAFAQRRPSRRRARLVAGAIVAAVVVAGGAALIGVGSASTARYRMAMVSHRSVDQVLHAVATIEPVSQATVAFPVSGTVSTVNVAAGDTVSIGQVLATLNTDALEATVTERQAALDQAKLVLDRALKGETASGANDTGAGSGGGSGTAPAQTIALTTPSSGANDADLSAAQQAVLGAQRQVDKDLRAAQQALAAAGTSCGTTGGTGAQSSTSTTTTTMPTTTPTTTPTSPTGPADADASTGTANLDACRAALQSVLTAQQQVASSQSALANAATALDELLARRAASAGNDAQASTPDAANSAAGASNSNSNSRSSNSSSQSSPSAQDLIAYQKAVDAAALQLAAAQQAVQQATMTSPIAGTVTVVNLNVGSAVSTASATDNIVIVGAGGYEATASVSVDDLPRLAVGQEATIVPDGTNTPIKGQVVRIGFIADTTSGTTTYPVVIGINGAATALHNGSIASASIVTRVSTTALAVPTSAVSTTGARHTVQVVEGDQTKAVTVEVGAMGPTWTEITGGLVAGQKVVLADVNEPLPSSATDTPANANGGPVRGAFPDGGDFVVRAGGK
jgi:HlyD family secretion protein